MTEKITHENLKEQADKRLDTEEMISSGELFLLRTVFERASYFFQAKNWQEFAERYPNTEKELIDAVDALQEWYSAADYPA